MTRRLEWFYDFSCPYAYLASTQIEALAERTGAELVHKPFLLGGVFKALGGEPMASLAPPRARMNGLDMFRWAEHWDVPLVMPAGHPNRTVLALRAALASGDLPRASRALFAAYWAEGRDLSNPTVVEAALTSVGFDGQALVRRADDYKNELRSRTDEAVTRGVFGAPAFFVDAELYWGQDRLDFVERALGGAPPIREQTSAPAGASVDFWYDFSSPFAYLAATSIESLSARVGAAVRFRPFLLGALFRAIGTADVPLFSFPEAKRRYFERDLERFAVERGVRLRFPSHFPIRSVLPLRVALAAGPDGARLCRALFDAAWRDDRDIADVATLGAVLAEQALDPSLLAAATSHAIKQSLRDNTAEAIARGVPGAPAFVVGDSVFWGQDRLLFVEKALGGWRPKIG